MKQVHEVAQPPDGPKLGTLHAHKHSMAEHQPNGHISAEYEDSSP